MSFPHNLPAEKVEDFISTTDPRPVEDPHQPHRSLGQIIFMGLHPQDDLGTLEKDEQMKYEKAALHLLRVWHNKASKPLSPNDEYAWATDLFVAVTTRHHEVWENVSPGGKESYQRAAAKAVKAVLLRSMTDQEVLMNGIFADQKESVFRPLSLGEAAYVARFVKHDFKSKNIIVQIKWDSAAQYLLYVWYQKATRSFRRFSDLPWGAHLYVGVKSSLNGGYEAWTAESPDLQASYEIAAARVILAMLLQAINLQQFVVNGTITPETLFPSD